MKPISEISGTDLKKRIARVSKRSSEITQELIDSGRGYEKPTETLTKDDSLSKLWKENHRELSTLLGELEARRTYHGSDRPIRRSMF